MDAMKKCSRCRQEKDLSEFYTDKRNGGRPMAECKGCFSLRSRAKSRRARLGHDWGHNDELYLTRLQGGRCAICGAEQGNRRFHLDHDHATGRARGLLCHSCNLGLGAFRDNPEWLDAAAAYLRGGGTLAAYITETRIRARTELDVEG